MIIHTGIKDIQNKVHKLKKVRKVITTNKRIDVNNEVQIPFSGFIHHDDQDFEEQINEIIRELENLCMGKRIKFKSNNIYGLYLNRSKLHLNKSGTVQLVKNFSQAIKPNWLCNFNDRVADKTTNFTSANNTSNISLLKNLRTKNRKNIIFS